MERWICTVCGYIHVGETPPDICPQCGAPKEKFVMMQDQDASMKAAHDALLAQPAGSTEVANEKEFTAIEQNTADVIVVGTGAAAFSAA